MYMYNILTIALVIYGLQATGEVNQDIIYTSQDLHLDPNQNEKRADVGAILHLYIHLKSCW